MPRRRAKHLAVALPLPLPRRRQGQALVVAVVVSRKCEEWWRRYNQGGLSQRDANWYQNRSRELNAAADAAWDEAEARSREAGHPFNNRHGQKEYPQPPKLGTIDLAINKLIGGIQSGDLGTHDCNVCMY